MAPLHLYHCQTLSGLSTLEQALGVSQCHRIPLNKIFHTLARKGFLETVIWETDVSSSEYKAEAQLYQFSKTTVDRLHFFRVKLESTNFSYELHNLKPEDYGGYCDLRPNTRSVVSAKISQYAVTRYPNEETYAYVCCSISHRTNLVTNSAPITTPSIRTFPCAQKDERAVMCSQASLLALSEYWNFRQPGMFKTTNSVEINRSIGVPDSEVLNSDEGRGLYLPEIIRFLKNEDIHALPLIYDSINNDEEESTSNSDEGLASLPPKVRSCQDVYGFIESGFPVMVCLEFDQDMVHALLCIGHTYDRNSWSAMADVAYFDKLGSGEGKYHANTTWIRNFIVHDDNFGPFYFMPTENIEKFLVAGFVVLPDTSIQIRPTDAADSAFTLLEEDAVVNAIEVAFQSSDFLNTNKFWLGEYRKHLKVQSGDGLVLRPVVIKGKNVIDQHNNHPTKELIENLMSGREEKYYWYVELTWPDIYCHRQQCCGCVVIDAENSDPLFLRIPGIYVVWEEKGPRSGFIQIEDPPRSHYGEKQVVG